MILELSQISVWTTFTLTQLEMKICLAQCKPQLYNFRFWSDESFNQSKKDDKALSSYSPSSGAGSCHDVQKRRRDIRMAIGLRPIEVSS